MFPGRYGVEKGWPLPSWGVSSFFSLLSSLSSLLSSLFSLLLVVVVLRRLDPMRRVTHSTHDKPCQLSCCCSELERLALSALFSLLSSLPPLFPLLSLLLISQIALRTCPFDLCIRPSTSHPTASTPGPAECAKRLNTARPLRAQSRVRFCLSSLIALLRRLKSPERPRAFRRAEKKPEFCE